MTKSDGVSSAVDVAAVQAITTVIHRCARALDRLDRKLLLGCFHTGATDDHSPFFQGSATDFVDWVLPALGGMLATRHVISNVLIERQGDCAGVESYWSAMLRMRQGDVVHVHSRGGRYLDRFSCIQRTWAIIHRQSITEWNRTDAELSGDLAPPSIPRRIPGGAMSHGARDGSDPSYTVLKQQR